MSGHGKNMGLSTKFNTSFGISFDTGEFRNKGLRHPRHWRSGCLLASALVLGLLGCGSTPSKSTPDEASIPVLPAAFAPYEYANSNVYGVSVSDTDTVRSVFPWGDNVPIDAPQISVSFNRSTQKNTLQLEVTPSVDLAGLELYAQRRFLRFVLRSPLQPGTTYTVRVTGQTETGEAIAGPLSTWSFRTAAAAWKNYGPALQPNNSVAANGSLLVRGPTVAAMFQRSFYRIVTEDHAALLVNNTWQDLVRVRVALGDDGVPVAGVLDDAGRLSLERYQNGAWVRLGGFVDWDANAEITAFELGVDKQNRPVVAWTELTGKAGFGPPARLFVKRFENNAWEFLGAQSSDAGLGVAVPGQFAIDSQNNLALSVRTPCSSCPEGSRVVLWDGAAWSNAPSTMTSEDAEFGAIQLEYDSLNRLVAAIPDGARLAGRPNVRVVRLDAGVAQELARVDGTNGAYLAVDNNDHPVLAYNVLDNAQPYPRNYLEARVQRLEHGALLTLPRVAVMGSKLADVAINAEGNPLVLVHDYLGGEGYRFARFDVRLKELTP